MEGPLEIIQIKDGFWKKGSEYRLAKAKKFGKKKGYDLILVGYENETEKDLERNEIQTTLSCSQTTFSFYKVKLWLETLA